MYIIVVGAGRVGEHFIEVATSEKNNLSVIEIDEETAKNTSSKYDVTVLRGDATEKDTIVEAGADRADALVATTSDDKINLMVVALAKTLEIPKIYSVASNNETVKLIEQQGAAVVTNPSKIVAAHLYNDMRRPQMDKFMSLHEDSQVFRLSIEADSSLIGKSLSFCMDKKIIPEGTLIIAIQRNEERWTPREETEILKDDIITVFSLKQLQNGDIRKLGGTPKEDSS